jgi:hypothetical protein
MLESMIAMASARMGVDLREELVDLLTGEFVSFVTPRSFAGATTPVAALSAIESIGTMLLGSKDSDALASTMMSLVDSAAMEMGGEFEWEDRDVTGGPTVHVLRGLDVVIGVDPVMAAGPGVLAISVDGSDLAPIVGGRQAESVLDTQLVGRRLKELRQASYAGVIHTSKTLASMVATWSSTFADGEWTRSDLEAYFGTHFSGTSVRTIERRPTYLRFYSGSN